MERDGTGTPRDGGTRLAPCIRASVLGIALTIGLPGAAVALDGATIAEQGNGQGAPGCSSCHGAGGEGQPSAGFPRLAGLDGGYLMKQLQEFASGKRANEIMGPIAKSLSDADMRALGAYYAGLATPKSQDEETADAAAVSAGAALAMHGDWSRDLPGCGQCHGPSGQGVGANFPALAGQSASYIVSQLAAWKAGTRANDPLDLMKSVAGKLDDDEVAAVAAYYASLPPAQSDASPTTETPR